MAGQWGYSILLASGPTGAGWFTGGAILKRAGASVGHGRSGDGPAPDGSADDTILAMTCCVVAFSILVQGLSISTLVRRVTLSQLPPDAETQPLH